MPISLASRVTVPADVMVSKVGEESVILDLNSERYFGLDPVGTSMWEALQANGTVEAAYATLLEEFDVGAEQLRSDLYDLLEKLREHGSIEVPDE